MVRLVCATIALLLALPGASMAAGRCGKYKMDGTGNCLTPAFYKCVRDWAKCSNACPKTDKANACADRCDNKYAPNCGD
jgi:hypothetical protein